MAVANPVPMSKWQPPPAIMTCQSGMEPAKLAGPVGQILRSITADLAAASRPPGPIPQFEIFESAPRIGLLNRLLESNF
jgi:hypothetical protein